MRMDCSTFAQAVVEERGALILLGEEQEEGPKAQKAKTLRILEIEMRALEALWPLVLRSL
jgi:hypothetical protein